MSGREKMLERFPELTPGLQAAARFIVDHPNAVVINSMRGVAEMARVQPATLVRLARKLGYGGWVELKSEFAEDLGLHNSSYGQRARNVAIRGRTHDLARELFSVQRHNLNVTEEASTAQLKQAARALKTAKAVHIAGFRASFPVAYSFFYGYRLFRNTVFLLDGVGAGLELQLRPISKRDAVVVSGFSPYSSEAQIVADYANSQGASVIALTDSGASPIALKAEIALCFGVESPSFFPSVAAGVALTEALLEQLVADAGAKCVQHIDEVERQLFESGAYLHAPIRRGPT